MTHPVANPIDCPDTTSMRQLVSGRLASPDADAVADHIVNCPACFEALHNLEPRLILINKLVTLAQSADESFHEVLCQLIDRLEAVPAVKRSAPPQGKPQLFNPNAPQAQPVEDREDDEGHARLVSSVVKFLDPPMHPGELGSLGSYRVLSVLGAGGMGLVLKAEDTSLQRPVALKVLKPEFVHDNVLRTRFLREARMAASIKHDHIVTIYQVGQAKEIPFLAMELLDGESLEARMKREGVVPLPEALRIGKELAMGLDVAHQKGLIHRDIKPGNIWLEAGTKRVKILDFGLARQTSSGTATLTEIGSIVGTPAYMAPEQARGLDIDGRADLFSVGCVMFHMFSGSMPFTGSDSMSILTAIVADPPVGIAELASQLPPNVATLLNRLLAKDPADRPASAAEVVESLTRAQAARPGVLKMMTPPGEQAPEATRAQMSVIRQRIGVEPTPAVKSAGGSVPWLPILAAAAGLLGVAGAVFWLFR